MRQKIDPVSCWKIEDYSRRTGRDNLGESTSQLIALGYRSFMGDTSAPAAVVAPSPDDDGSIRGRTVSAHVSQPLIDAIGRLCQREGRSTSSALRMLIRTGLNHHGDPQPEPAATEPGPHRRRLAAAAAESAQAD